MTQRKPPGVSFETWIDRQIRQAADRGEFDDLPGTGKPIADLDRPYDEMWWIRQKMQRENLSYLPPTLALRKEAEDALAAASAAGSEPEVRRIVTEINDKIREANRKPSIGPPLGLVPFDVDGVVRAWSDRHPDRNGPAPTAEPPDADDPQGDPRGEPRGPARPRRRWRLRR